MLVLARRAAGLTQRQLAVRAGTRQSAISQIERGEVEPTFSRLRSLVGLCGYELGTSLEPRRLSIDEGLLLHSLRMLPEERISAAIRLSRFTQRLHADGQRVLAEQLDSEHRELRELAGL